MRLRLPWSDINLFAQTRRKRLQLPFRLASLILLFAFAVTAAPSPALHIALHIPAGAQAGPSFNVETATRAYLDSLPADKKARSNNYFEGGYWLILWDFLYGATISILLLETRLSARMRDLAGRLTLRRPIQTAVYWGQYSVLTYILYFPLGTYEGFFREHKYGLSNMSLSAWLGDEGKNQLLSILLGGLVVALLFGIVRKLPRTWHLWGAGAAIVFQAIGIMIAPVFIAPLFNKYTILQDAAIKDPILRIARQNGIPATDVYEVDASRQSNRVSANVSGFLGTERITLNDNLLNRCSPEAVLAVMGHEMGHYVMNHIYKMMVFVGIFMVAIFVILRRALDWSLAKWGSRWQIRGVGDPAVIPLAMLIISVISLLYLPINNTLTRTQEYEADIFGLNTARQPDGFAEAALLLSEYRKMEPGPVEEFIFFDHPSGRTRIVASMRWKAENLSGH
jgi:STE24 endopeptidase